MSIDSRFPRPQTADVEQQLERLPETVTHLVVSSGGNDALDHIGILEQPASTSGEVLDLLSEIAGRFEERYREMMNLLRATGLPLTLCTIYNGEMPEDDVRRRAITALTVFNDVILRVAFEAGARVIDLRSVCSLPEHYANPIEPSAVGGARIADAIARAITTTPPHPGRSDVFL